MIIHSIRRDTGSLVSMRSECVVVVAVHRGGDDGETLKDDTSIGELPPDHRFEFVQIYCGRVVVERTTWVTSDAAVWELGPDEGRWDAPIATGIVVTKRSVLE